MTTKKPAITAEATAEIKKIIDLIQFRKPEEEPYKELRPILELLDQMLVRRVSPDKAAYAVAQIYYAKVSVSSEV